MRGRVVGAAVAVAVTGGTAVRAGRRASAAKHAADGRWRAVTINLPPAEVMPDGTPPAPLADWGDAVEVTVRPAPGGRGTELAARLRDPAHVKAPADLEGDTPVQRLRSSLRRAKQLLETGGTLTATTPGTSHATPWNAPLRRATRLAGGGGRR